MGQMVEVAAQGAGEEAVQPFYARISMFQPRHHHASPLSCALQEMGPQSLRLAEDKVRQPQFDISYYLPVKENTD